MRDGLTHLDTWAGVLLAKLEPPARRTLARTIATELRRSQQQRIAAQLNPDGTAYAPRKPRLRDKRGAIRRRAAMFAKLRTARWLKANSSADAAEIGFVGRVARLARVHQEGLRDRVALGGREIRYPTRALLGFTIAERESIRTRVLDHLAR